MTRFFDRTADQLHDIDLEDDRLSYPEAAIVAGVPVATVRQWKSRHHLKPADRGADGRLRFRPADVLRANEEALSAIAGRPRSTERGAA